MDNQRIYSAAIIGGSVSAIMFSVPFLNMINCFCCIGIMSGGVVGLLYYHQSFEIKEFISPANAITIGLAVGIAGAFISVLMTWVIYLMFGNWELEFLKKISDSVQDVPEMTGVFDDMLNEVEQESYKGMYLGRLLIELVRNLIIIPIFAMAGSLITRIFINKNIQKVNQYD